MNELNLRSLRSKKARAANFMEQAETAILALTCLAIIAATLLFLNDMLQLMYLASAVALLGIIFSAWYKLELKKLEVRHKKLTFDDMLEAHLLGSIKKRAPLTPTNAWQYASKQWEGVFIINHLMLDSSQIIPTLSTTANDMTAVWKKAKELVDGTLSKIDGGVLITAVLLTSEPALKYLSTLNLKGTDITEALGWQQRLAGFFNQPKPYFGGIGRDWAAGYTPTLDQYGENISRAIEAGRAGHFHTLAHSDILDTMVHNLSKVTGGLAVVGDVGVGKTSLTFALAQRLLEGRDESLRYYQIVSLDASQILSDTEHNLEQIMLRLLGEAVHARNIIIYLDDAQLFFGKGAGAFDMGQILTPLLKTRAIKIITAFTPNDFQRLKTSNEALASNMAVINVNEPSAEVVMDILEDTALTIEQGNRLIVSYDAVREAYRLGGQYFQDQAYPGKAIKLLEQAIPYCQDEFMTAASIQSAVEKTLGVKVGKAEALEADVLLHLEDHIHERMVNQTRATKEVADALRRGRSGVANPNRPIGTFLFLGPTGVGKTELARSLAANYYGDDKKMVRLDMSEYQQPEDIDRLLAGNSEAGKSFLMSMREQPFSVVLLDEVEKAHPNFLNLLLQMLDEGQLTDKNGKPASFKNAIVICTSNAGSAEIVQRLGNGESLDDFEKPLIDQLISQGIFKPELINRYDEVVLFRPLNTAELAQVAQLMIGELNRNLAKQNVQVKLSDEAMARVVEVGYNPEFGARPMRHAIQQLVENVVANRILSGQTKPGDTVVLEANDLEQ